MGGTPMMYPLWGANHGQCFFFFVCYRTDNVLPVYNKGKAWEIGSVPMFPSSMKMNRRT